MAPRKRTRVSQAASPTTSRPTKSPTPAPASSPPAPQRKASTATVPASATPLSDPWTDEEEAGLFKGLLHYKPTGFHKHFRLLALHQYLLTNHYIDPRNEHTRPAGIWRKLDTLYDMSVLDEREDSRQLCELSIPDDENDNGENQSGGKADGDEGEGEKMEVGDDDDDAYSEAANKIHQADFALPEAAEEGFAALQWRARFPAGTTRRGSSPFSLDGINTADDAPIRFTPSFSVDEAGSTISERATPSGTRERRTKGVAQTGRGKGGVVEVPRNSGSLRKSKRQAENVAEEEEEEDEEEGEEEGEDEEEEESGEEEGSADDEDGEGEEEEESEGKEESNEGTPARSTRAARGGRAKGGATTTRGRKAKAKKK